ncbi:MAG: alpha-L-fucosidase [Defluviitaleaceae bacterium]|nr:alpha-L-fucosidase [Defluviitaleaceae bacterium]
MGTWYKNAKSGLFVHWGINTENEAWDKGETLHITFEDFEAEVNKRGWDAQKWVDAALKIRASYISFAIFHSCLGYIKAWKSKIPGTYTTKRDFLGELIAAAAKHDIKVVLYLSGDTTGYRRHPYQPWIFPDEYKAYKNDNSINIIDDRHWQQIYVKDIIEEVIDNYPTLAGFWFDGWNNPVTNEAIFGFIHEKNPELLNFRNNFETCPDPHEDIMSLESFNKVLNPHFDLASGAWANPGGKEYCYTVKELSDWFQCYPPAENYNKADAIRKFVTIRTNGWVPHVGLGPNIGGDFNGSLGHFLDDMDEFLSWAGESLFDTTPGGLPAGYMNDGAYILVCQNQNAVYIHAMRPPTNKTLIIPDGGCDYEKATNLKTGKEIHLTQQNGELALACDSDMIIKLIKVKSRISQTLDNPSYMKSLPTEIIIENNTTISGLLIEQDEASATTRGGWAAVENNRAKDYVVLVSNDSISYAPHSQGSLSGSRGTKQINFPPTSKIYIKLQILTAYDTSPGYIKKFVNGFWEYPDISPDDIIPQKEIIINAQKYICRDDGTVRIYGAEGNNIYKIGAGATGIAQDENGKLLAIMPPETGRLRFTKVSTINLF